MQNAQPMTLICLLSAALLVAPARADDNTGCTLLAQSAAAGMAARIAADNQTVKPPQSVTKMSCLNNFFNGAGLDVITNLLNPETLLQSVEGQICNAVQSTWTNFTNGAAQCGLTVTGFNVGFGGLGGGAFCPKLSFGGGGTQLGSIGTGMPNDQNGLYLNGIGSPPTGYQMPPSNNTW